MTIESYFTEDGKQTRPLPKRWMDPSNFAVGDRIQYLEKGCYAGIDLREHIGTVVEVRSGYGEFPSRWVVDDDGGFWAGQHAAWLVVDFGPKCAFGHGTFHGQRYARTTLALSLDEQGKKWRRSEKAGSK